MIPEARHDPAGVARRVRQRYDLNMYPILALPHFG